MCGRYTGYVDDSDELKTIYTIAKAGWYGKELKTGEIFPTDTVPLVIERSGILAAAPAMWGFPSPKGKGVIINARAETAVSKPAFADCFQNRRCIIPSTGYFEWSQNKEKYHFRDPNRAMLYLAGLYNFYDDGIRFVILTTCANASVSDVHDRMPVILRERELGPWERDIRFAAKCIGRVMPQLVRTAV
nr:SOS response-associated peptidase [Clostridia bacterium]